MDQKKELGKGIRALLGNMDTNKTSPSTSVSPLASVQMIAIEQIEKNPYQPRNEFEKNALDELAATIKIHGIIQPITVRKIANNRYQLISGERRTKAAQLIGLKELPAYIRSANDQSMLEMALIENVQRENLNAIEVAISMARLIEECKLTHNDMSSRLGKDRSTVTNYLRLLKLPPDIQQAVKTKKISMGHARALAGIDNLVLQIKLFKEAILHEWSVRQLESTIKSYEGTKTSNRQEKDSKPADHFIKPYTDKANAIFGRKTIIKSDKKGRGSLTVPFTSLDELNELLDRISV
ncbi:MAG: ParB/RepB/Spo0J family partition protein [Saprospiraceae bacterium]|nr:ParB/RepB/Spo0J family partition protein [Saprospiraceae bacterium]MBK9931662.1 ParB/RepB/Spo0J family partition protein [Saprospiraceae bacterium]MBP7803752.1 ParB/RepB/Spo0J family partition protein [Saprospiraceae bacterium]MBP7923997.1 ParB/RepB/Spo0J family partition protein [Saprospiraceae bacterium]MBP8095761.1 ParB/RepB/Spo0J family partition protein [Saprospiraceae bacterium]